MTRCACVALVLGSAYGLMGCGSASAPAPTEAKAPMVGLSARSCARVHPGVGLARANTDRQSGAVVLAKAGDRNFAYIADADSKSVHTIDVDDGREVGTTTLPGAPSQLLILADGRIAATLQDTASVAVLEPGDKADAPLELRCTAMTPSEPVGMALTPDDKTLLVVSAWGHALTAMDTATMTAQYGVDLKRDPRSVIVDDAGERAFISHGVGADVSVIDLVNEKHDMRAVDVRVSKSTARNVDPKLRTGAQSYVLVKAVETPGFGPEEKGPIVGKQPGTVPVPAIQTPIAPPTTTRIFVPMVTVDPGDPNVRSQAYYGPVNDGVPKEAPVVAVIDPSAERSLSRSKLSLGTPLSKECLLPRAAAYRQSTKTLLVACAGIDSVLELDTRGGDPARLEVRRFNVPSGPLGIALDDTHNRAVVWSQFDGEVSILDLDPAHEHAKSVELVHVKYEPTPDVADTQTGRKLFFGSDDTRIANDGVACASCHPEGREDSITWSTPEGPRQTIMLAGRLPNTAPYGWAGKHGDLKTYVTSTFARLGGTGLDQPNMNELISYLDRLPGPSAANVAWHDGKLMDDQPYRMEGRELFYDDKTGCASCHAPGVLTDKTLHDVGSKATADLITGFDTPSLKFISGSAPYFHDGRYATLEDLLNAPASEMGHTAHLSRHEREAMKSYLESL